MNSTSAKKLSFEGKMGMFYPKKRNLIQHKNIITGKLSLVSFASAGMVTRGFNTATHLPSFSVSLDSILIHAVSRKVAPAPP